MAWVVSRRDFLKASGLAAAGLTLGQALGGCIALRLPDDVLPPEAPLPTDGLLRFGLFTDAHYADVDHRLNRYYRQSLPKLDECLQRMTKGQAELLVELGDFKDMDEPPDAAKALAYLRTIERRFEQFKGARYHVLGNHELDCLSKEQVLGEIRSTGIPRDRAYYSFDHGPIHFIVLDANFRGDGVAYHAGNFDWTETIIPEAQLAWLAGDLAAAAKPSLVFVHQRLDGAGDYYVNNAEAVRRLLVESGKVLAVFQGHDHSGGYRLLEGIHYYTLKAMVTGKGPKNNAYALVDVLDDGSLIVTGFRRVKDRLLAKQGASGAVLKA